MSKEPTDGRSRAPWNAEQVAALAAWQQSREFHPFTCPGERAKCRGQRSLIPQKDGWVCACGEYRQDWAHDFMMSAGVVP